MYPQFNQPKGSTTFETNKESIARRFGCKRSEVIYAKPGQSLSGYKIIFDKVSERAYSLPPNLGSATITSITDGVLVHSGGTVDLGALAVVRGEYNNLWSDFNSGFIIRVKNEVVSDGTYLYRWAGALPKTVNAGSTVAGTGDVTSTTWIRVGVDALRKELSGSKGTDLIGYQIPMTGSVARSVTDRLANFVSVLDFGADPTGVKDSSAAFQAACDQAATVYVPVGIYRIDNTVVVKRSVTIIGEGNSGQINRAMSFININGNIPFIANWQQVGNMNSMFQLHVKRLFVQYNPNTRPETESGNSNKVAFNFYSTTPEANGLEFCSFEDVVVMGAWAAYWDRTGTYMTELKRFEARNCRFGFLKATGTTITLENCFTNSCRTSYQFGGMSTVKMDNCGMDNTSVSLANGSLGGAAVHFTGVRSFTINNFDAEICRVTTDGGGIASLFHAEDSVGTVNGWVGLHNDLVTEGAGLGGSVVKFRLSNKSLVKFTACEDEFFRDEKSKYYGNGYGITVLSDETSQADMELCRMHEPVVASGTPQLLVLSQGNVEWYNCDITGLVVSGGTVVNAKAGALSTDLFISKSGTKAVAANTQTTLFTLPSKGSYLVSVMADGSGVNFSSSAQFIWDGSATAQHNMLAGAFTVLGAAGATVFVTCQGATTLTWSFIRIM